ncbi:MAG TPA: histidine phosphatase family protein [Rhizomicrobium sp.]|nr:histidine phosphatase family protein [Rhizomicrobium sp.]
MSRADFRALTLYVLRHGECEHTLLGVVAGQNDSPLTALGRKQAHENGIRLRELTGSPGNLGHYASPLHRTATTMEIVREAAGLPAAGYVADRRLMELDCGDNTWRSWTDIHADLERDPAWVKDRWNHRHPHGESLAMLHERVGHFLQTLTRNSVIVAHAGTIRMIRAHMLGLSHDETIAYHAANWGILRLSSGSETFFGE